ncbi:MAG: RagB/SusD family nutrient uptake outer membrane protein, partial [Saprospiraceae bacterium]|nr:RagB/SusD family nutrient uptake outer membrane protein [Saprospiraceae bacterium]
MYKSYIKINKCFWAGLLFILMVGSQSSCEINDLVDPNNPDLNNIESNASLSEMQNLVDGIESWMRDRLGTYLDGVGVIGREYYRFSGSDPRFTSDLLGKGSAVLDNNTFYTTRPFESRYRTVKNANILLDAIANTRATVTTEQVSATRGFAKTIQAHQLLQVLMRQYTCGIRIDVTDPDNLGPFLDFEASLNGLESILNDANNDLQSGGGAFP